VGNFYFGFAAVCLMGFFGRSKFGQYRIFYLKKNIFFFLVLVVLGCLS
jgi:hypothetical protein